MAVENTMLSAEQLRAFPKVELHRHLEGTFSLSTLHAMARRNGLSFPDDIDEFQKLVQFPKDSQPDFLRFLSLFKNDWYRSLDDVAEITAASVRDLSRDGIFYIELRFSPEHFAYHNGFDREEVTRTVVAAADAAAAETGVEIRYLITLTRHKQEEDAMIDLYTLIRDLMIPSVVGIDLAGDETNFPPELFVRLFSAVKSDGVLRSTIHAGEVSPATQIWESIELLGADRIGHGVSAIHDPELQKMLADRGVALEQCITSNYQTGAWADESTHPLGRLHRQGVPVTINSDDPFIQNTDLSEDYHKAARYFGFGLDDFVHLNLCALDAAFLPDSEREQLKRRYLNAVAAFREQHVL